MVRTRAANGLVVRCGRPALVELVPEAECGGLVAGTRARGHVREASRIGPTVTAYEPAIAGMAPAR